jgi:hypothetical protein
MRQAETHATIFEFGGPRVYSYEQFLRAVAHQAGLAPLLIPIPFAVWHALAWASEILPGPPLTRNQVELINWGAPGIALGGARLLPSTRFPSFLCSTWLLCAGRRPDPSLSKAPFGWLLLTQSRRADEHLRSPVLNQLGSR